MSLRGFVLAAALGLGALAASCETMSVEECAAADWRALGFNDASSSGTDRFGSRAESCGEKGITADGGAYAAGFSEGMYQFCQPPAAFNYALRGNAFNGSCPAELQQNFYAAYGDGRRIYEARSELDSARSRLSAIDPRIDDIDDDIREKIEAQRGAPQDVRERLQREIADLREERRDLVDERRDLQPRLTYLERRVGDLRMDIGNRWGPW
jgi:hypothetical protein